MFVRKPAMPMCGFPYKYILCTVRVGLGWGGGKVLVKY